MRSLAYRLILAVAGVLTGGGWARAQDLPAATNPPVAADRSGSPVAVLESLTGGRAADSGRDRDGEGEREGFETDRDSFTPATSTVGRRRLLVESAYSFIDNPGVKPTHSVPELVMRYGLTDRVELRLGWNYEVGGVGNEISGTGAADENPTAERSSLVRDYTLSYGVKVQVTNQDRWLPRSAVIVQAFTPTGGSTGSSTATNLIATYAAGWVLPNRWRFDTSFRYGTDSEGGDRFNQWAPSAVLSVPLGEKWAVHAEYFGIYSTGKAENSTEHYFSPGVHYLVSKNLEVGCRVGWGLNEQSARFFSNVGFGWGF